MCTPSRHAAGMLSCQALSTSAVQVSDCNMNRFYNLVPITAPEILVRFRRQADIFVYTRLEGLNIA